MAGHQFSLVPPLHMDKKFGSPLCLWGKKNPSHFGGKILILKNAAPPFHAFGPLEKTGAPPPFDHPKKSPHKETAILVQTPRHFTYFVAHTGTISKCKYENCILIRRCLSRVCMVWGTMSRIGLSIQCIPDISRWIQNVKHNERDLSSQLDTFAWHVIEAIPVSEHYRVLFTNCTS